MRFFIIHGTYGNPEENWFQWLKKELEKLGHQAFIPKFPTPKKQSLKIWMEEFKKYMNVINSETVFIGHSLGPAFILSILEQLDCKIGACYFVSGFIGSLNNEEFDKLNKTFMNKSFEWEKIKRNCNKFIMFHSDDDPYVSIEKAKHLASKLNAEFNIIKGAGHFNEDSGHTSFELLLKKIKNL